MSVYNLDIAQGATLNLQIQLVDQSNNNLLATATLAEAWIVDPNNSNNTVAEIECSFTANNAALSLYLDANTTLGMYPGGPYTWDLKLTWPSQVEYPLSGKVRILPTVTR
jgi:hypothetical protein